MDEVCGACGTTIPVETGDQGQVTEYCECTIAYAGGDPGVIAPEEAEATGLSPEVEGIVTALRVKLAAAERAAVIANEAGDYWTRQACEARVQAEKYRQAWTSARRRASRVPLDSSQVANATV